MHNLLPFLHVIFHADPHPARSLRDVNVFLPTTSDCDAIQMDLLVLISRVLVSHVPPLRVFQDLVPSHIMHKHSEETSRKSIVVSFITVTV
jgi:hypothetical protein